jgi:nucleotide-binding universal stress UspA family protein
MLPGSLFAKISGYTTRGATMKILIALDDSECSDLAFHTLLERTWPEGAEFRILTVVEPIYMQPSFGGMYMEPAVNAQIEFEKLCKMRVKEKVNQMHEAFPNYVVEGETIIDEARSWPADLVVVGSHGRRGFSRFFLGSVAERVAGHAPCSVEIIKHKVTGTEKCVVHDKQEKSAEPVSTGAKN